MRNITKPRINRQVALLLAPIAAIALVMAALWAVITGLQPTSGGKRIIIDPAIDRMADPRTGADTSRFPEFVAPPREAISDAEAATAREINAATPVNPGAIELAQPFRFDLRLPALDRLRARECLAAAIYYEAGSESVGGQRAVAQVVLNRVRHPAFPNTVCDVVFQGSTRSTGCQFTFTCDGSLARRPSVTGWRRALAIADMALAGLVEPSVGTATHYHADWVAPYWRTSLTKLANVGTHVFYRWQGGWGQRRAFSIAYRGGEIDHSQQLALAFALPPAAPGALDAGDVTGVGQPLAATPARSPLPDAAPVKADSARAAVAADERSGALVADNVAGTLRR